MQRKKCFATLGVLRRKVLGYGRRGVTLTIVIATLTLARGAAGSQLDGESDRAGVYKTLHLFTWAKNPSGNLIFDVAGNLYGTTQDGGSGKCPGGCGAVWRLARNPKATWTVSILHAFTGADGSGPAAGLIFDAAGNLYGTTSGGGADGYGVVFELTPNPDGTWTESVLHSFTGGADGALPFAGLIFDTIGNLYGTTYYGPLGCAGLTDGCGTVFRLTPNPDGTWTESVLHSFTEGAGGGNPAAGLIFDAAGNLYGTTNFGTSGPGNLGTVFKLTPNPDGTWTESVLHSFTGADGAVPDAGLIFDAAGNLYGTTSSGGISIACIDIDGCGVVFKLSPTSTGWSETVLHTFIGFGSTPRGGVIFDQAGNLYGTTSDGNPAFDYGLVFEITRVGAADGIR
jgi:uncharacterized repeat protein (TIGR03803 family)